MDTDQVVNMASDDEVAARVAALLRIVDADGRPNVNELWKVAKDIEAIKLNVKFFGYALAKQLAAALPPARAGVHRVGLASKLTTQADIESAWFAHWMHELHLPVLYSRKLWEFAYVLQAFYEGGKLAPGMRGIGFGCGAEPIASYLASRGVSALVTDLPAEDVRAKGWSATSEHAPSLAYAYKPELVSREEFERLVAYREVDMMCLPADLRGFDFCWSICALEHLGTLTRGLDFIENAMDCLHPGGVAVHTTEFNCLNEDVTVENASTVFLQRRHIEDIAERLAGRGHLVAPLEFDLGSGLMDHFIDVPPFPADVSNDKREFIGSSMQHLKVAGNGFIVTCFGITITKASG